MQKNDFIPAVLVGSLIPVFPDPYHPEKYGGTFQTVNFWEWLAKKLYEVYSGVELRLGMKRQHELAIEPATALILANSGRTFDYSVELGCGLGGFGSILQNYCHHLVGVDINPAFLKFAEKTNCYTQLVLEDVRDYVFPDVADSIFMFETIEHLSKEDGLQLIEDSGNRYVMISTPAQFFSDYRTHHVSLWTANDFYSLGFDVWVISGSNVDILLAVRDKNV